MINEEFNRTLVFDFSKLSQENINKVKGLIEQYYPEFAPLMEIPKKKLTPDDVFELLAEKAFGATKCNFPVEKFGIIFCLPEKTGEIKKTTENKNSFFLHV